MDYWNEIGRRANFIRNLYQRKAVIIEPESPLDSALVAAEKLAMGENAAVSSSRDLNQCIKDYHVVYAIAETLETCEKSNLDLTDYLKQLKMGTTNYGTPAESGSKEIFLKDFEFELFLTSVLIKYGLKPSFPQDQNDPKGDIIVDEFYIEAKHPNSKNPLKKHLRKFNSALRQGKNLFGLFAVGLEDGFDMGDQFVFQSAEEHGIWRKQKLERMEKTGKEIIKQARSQQRILGLIQVSSEIAVIAGVSQMTRYTNAFLFDERASALNLLKRVDQIAKAFFHAPVYYSNIKNRIDLL